MPGLFVNSSEVQNPPYGQWPRQHYGGCSAECTPARPPQKRTAVIIHRCEHSGAEKQPTHKPDQCPDDRRHNVFSVKPHRTPYVVAQRIERQDKLTRHTGLIARTYGFRCSLDAIYYTGSPGSSHDDVSSNVHRSPRCNRRTSSRGDIVPRTRTSGGSCSGPMPSNAQSLMLRSSKYVRSFVAHSTMSLGTSK